MSTQKAKEVVKAVVQPRPEEVEENTFYGVKLKRTSRRRQADPENTLGDPTTQDVALPNGATIQLKLTPKKFPETHTNKKGEETTVVRVGFSVSVVSHPDYYGYGQIVYKAGKEEVEE